MLKKVKMQVKLGVGNESHYPVFISSEILGFVKALSVFVIDAVKKSVNAVVYVFRPLCLVEKLFGKSVVYLLFSVPAFRIVSRADNTAKAVILVPVADADGANDFHIKCLTEVMNYIVILGNVVARKFRAGRLTDVSEVCALMPHYVIKVKYKCGG